MARIASYNDLNSGHSSTRANRHASRYLVVPIFRSSSPLFRWSEFPISR